MRTPTQLGLNKPLAVLLHRLALRLRDWTDDRMRREHRRANWKWLRRRYLPG